MPNMPIEIAVKQFVIISMMLFHQPADYCLLYAILVTLKTKVIMFNKTESTAYVQNKYVLPSSV